MEHEERFEPSMYVPGSDLSLRVMVQRQARMLYPDCSCNEAWVYAWNVPFKYMEAMTVVHQWHQQHCVKHHEGNGRYQGAFAFTLTSSPKDGLSVGDLLAAVKKVMNQKSQPPIRYAWYLEYTGKDDEGLPIHPHIHGMYELADGKKIEDKHWKRAWTIWKKPEPDGTVKILGQGFRGGYHRPVKQEENYSDYIAKDGGVSESYNVDDSAT